MQPTELHTPVIGTPDTTISGDKTLNNTGLNAQTATLEECAYALQTIFAFENSLRYDRFEYLSQESIHTRHSPYSVADGGRVIKIGDSSGPAVWITLGKVIGAFPHTPNYGARGGSITVKPQVLAAAINHYASAIPPKEMNEKIDSTSRMMVNCLAEISKIQQQEQSVAVG